MTLHALSLGTLLFFGGIWAGANLMMLVERVRTWQRMPASVYGDDFRRTMRLSHSFLAATALCAVVAGSVFSSTSVGKDQVFAMLGTGLIGLLAGAASFIDVLPQPALRGDARQGPPRDAAHRAIWRRLHLGRTVAALLAFFCFGAAGELTPTEWMMVIFGGLWSGGVCFLAVERTRAWHAMSLEEFLPDFRVSVRFIDPLMPVCCITSALATAFFSHDSTGLAAMLGWFAVGITTGGAVGSGLVSAPPVLGILRAKADPSPIELAKGRKIIVACNVGRTVAAVLAFSCLSAAVVVRSGF